MERSFDFGALLQLHEKKHKYKPMQFVNVESGRQKRLETNRKLRKSSRLTVFDRIRNLQASEAPKKANQTQTKVEHRKMQLEKWKEEKEKKKKMAEAHKKKPFVTGIPHPSLKYEPPPPPKVMPALSGRVTRSQTSKAIKTQQNILLCKAPVIEKKPQSFAPKHATFKPPDMKNIKSFPTLAPQPNNKKNTKILEFNPVLPDCTKLTHKVVNSKPQTAQKQTESKKKVVKNKKPKTPQKSTQVTKMVSPNNPVPKSESSSEERLRSPKSPPNVESTPKQTVEFKLSPRVTVSRGKDNARREMKIKIKEGLLDDDASDMDSVGYFRQQMDSEIKHITELCDTWDKILEQTVLPETVQEAVLSVVGQGRLLMAQKMQQFAALVGRCAQPEPGHPLVTPADLHGFWDMLFMQVVDVDMRFKKLEGMKARNWTEEAQAPAVQRKKAAPVKAAAKPAATSRLRDMIAAARKAKKQEAPECPAQDAQVQSSPETTKKFEAGFFCVRSPVRQATPSTPSCSSLLKSILSTEAKISSTKSNNSASLAILRASLIGKNMDTNEVLAEPLVPLTPISLTATPSRSILKPLNTISAKKFTKKSVTMVLFNESDADNDSLTEAISEMTMDVPKENVKNKRKSLVRQLAVEDRSPVMTRSRHKSISTPSSISLSPSVRRKDVEEITPRRFSLRKRQEADK